MKSISIGSATSIYATASKCEIIRHWVDHAELANASRTFRSLSQSLGPEAEEEFWRRVLKPIRRFVFALCSTPMPFELVARAVCIDWDEMHRQVRLCGQQYPDSHADLSSMVQNLQNLSEEASSPIITTLESLRDISGGISVVLHGPRMNQPVATYFAASAELRNAKVVSVRQLREAHLCDVLVVIGPCGWFPDYMFLAPRATRIHVISFRWIRDKWKPGPVFLNGIGAEADNIRKHYIGALPQLRDQNVQPNQTLPDFQPLELLPPRSFFSKSVSRIIGGQPDAADETLLARLCYLSGDRAVFVSTDEGASSLVIDPTETGNSVVRRVRSNELEPELFLLLRTSGGGDLITPLADHILGGLASERRSQQAEWKTRLISAAHAQFGIVSRRELAARVAGNLRLQNLSDAHAENIHYWMSSKCIRPRKGKDFAAILAFAGIANNTEELWEAMGDIDRAHKMAGRRIRQMLLEKITTLSLEPLERDGEMVFDLGEQDGGAFSAFQIIGISEDEFEIPADRIGVLQDSEE